MFVNNVETKYYVTDREDNSVTCLNHAGLIRFLYRVTFSINNKILSYDKIDFSGHDTYTHVSLDHKLCNVRDFDAEYDAREKILEDWKNNRSTYKEKFIDVKKRMDAIKIYKIGFMYVRTVKTIPRRYVIRDINGKIVNVRLFEKEVLSSQTKTYRGMTKRERHTDDVKRGEKLFVPAYLRHGSLKICFNYREDPVPHVHNYNNWHRNNPGHRAQLSKLADEIRPKTRIDICELWDGRNRHTDNNWKTSTKCRHQWEKHMVRKSKSNNVYVQKGNSKYNTRDWEYYTDEDEMI